MTTTTTASMPPGSIDILSLSSPQLSSLQSRLSTELDHLTTSYSRLQSARARFRSCITCITTGLVSQSHPPSPELEILVPLTQSLYVPGTLASTEKVIVDVGTGFFVQKSTDDAVRFYEGKVGELGRSLAELERVVQGKNENLRIVEEVLRQKVMAEQQGQGQGQGQGQAAAAGG